ncbi:hypothetical protein G7085_00900 [Tessaracoccus sp. HDW20]|nr:hypothetical protein [Tessaracoccus coleopterorum]NHB83747.1 hypothetical protein [Tessaracoccus coleopterorum]
MAITNLDAQLTEGRSEYVAASSGSPGLLAPLRQVTAGMDWDNQRPREQWWMKLRPCSSSSAVALARSSALADGHPEGQGGAALDGGQLRPRG